jgi:exodeoxyribonuclease V beta subunit
MAENLRLLYVALTRAVHRCYLFWGPINGAETSAPAYLLHQGFPAAENSGGSVTGINDLMKKVADRFPGLSDHEILTDLHNLASAADGTIRITTSGKLPGNYLPDSKDPAVVLRCRQFTGDIRRDWKISSFSSLIEHRSAVSQESYDLLDEAPDRDAHPVLIPGADDLTESGDDKYNIFSFPQGAKPGTFLHELLEQADFSSKPPVPASLICEKLQYFGYETTWAPVLTEMLYNLGNVTLHKDIPDLKLSSIPLANCLHELEFYYPLSRLTTNDLKHIFCSMDLQSSADSTATFMDRQLDNLTFAPARGFMRGFIDLVFEFAGKFYLADWKSNHLGSSIGCYRRDILREPILSGYYFLQYHLYCLALHLYLEKRLPGYEYESHFGGVFYVFLRGVNQDLGPEYGIYHDLPPLSTIEMLGAKHPAE